MHACIYFLWAQIKGSPELLHEVLGQKVEPGVLGVGDVIAAKLAFSSSAIDVDQPRPFAALFLPHPAAQSFCHYCRHLAGRGQAESFHTFTPAKHRYRSTENAYSDDDEKYKRIITTDESFRLSLTHDRGHPRTMVHIMKPNASEVIQMRRHRGRPTRFSEA